MKKLLLIFILLLTACSSTKTDTPWIGTYKKDNITLTIVEAEDNSAFLDYTFDNEDDSISDLMSVKSDSKAISEMDDMGATITFKKNGDRITVTTDGDVYLENIDGSYTRE